MKRRACALLLALGLVTLFQPAATSFAQELPLERVSSGTYTVVYGGQNFRVSSAVLVSIKFETISPTEIKVTVVSKTGATGRCTIYWVEFDKYVFQGMVPVAEPWEGTLNTEGGFIDR